jgi:predicted lipoprotein with Yx(FWY)xxD motif
MKTKLIALGVMASLLATAGCNQDVAEPTAVNPDPEVSTTPNEAASQAREAMPDTMPATPATTTPGTGVPGTPATGATLMASASPAPGGGSYVADSAGSALYMLEGDRDGSKCTGPCLQAWPPLLVGETQPTAGDGLQAGMVASIQRPDGSMQVTYNHRPLHRYAADSGVGRTAGHGVRDQWGEWHLLTPAGEKVAAKR